MSVGLRKTGNVVFGLTLVLISFCSLFVACSKKQGSNVELGSVNQVLHYANGDEPKSLDPHLTTGSPDNNIIINLLEGLTSKHPRTLDPIPGVAESWTVSDDRRVYTFKLRDNALWSNGDPVTSNDFVFSWRRALTPSLPNHYAYMLYHLVNAQAYHQGELNDFSKVGVEAVSRNVLKVTLKFPAHYFLQLLGHHSYYPVHRETIEAYGEMDDASALWTRAGNFVGNGAFTLSKWSLNNEIVLTKSQTYWDKDMVKLSSAHIYPIEGPQAEERAFRSGFVHLTNTPLMDIEKIAVYRKKEPDSLRVSPNYSSYFYEFNTTKVPFNDVKVRRALSMAIDRQQIVEWVTKGGEVPAFSFVANDPFGYKPKQYFDYDVAKAQALLVEAGYPQGRRFPSVSIMYNTHANHKKVALAIQQMLKTNLNIDVTLENREWKVFMSARQNLEHDIARAGWLADFMDPSNFFDLGRSLSGNNKTGWKSEGYDRLMLELDRTEDQSERFAIFEKANRILADEMPVIPLYYYSDINLVLPSVQGWHNNPMHFHPLKGVSISLAKEQ